MDFSTLPTTTVGLNFTQDPSNAWCVITNNASYPTVKYYITAYHAFGKY